MVLVLPRRGNRPLGHGGRIHDSSLRELGSLSKHLKDGQEDHAVRHGDSHRSDGRNDGIPRNGRVAKLYGDDLRGRRLLLAVLRKLERSSDGKTH